MKATLLILAAAAAAAVPAAASPTAGADRVYDLGRCVVKADREAAAQLLQDLPVTAGEAEIAPFQLGDGAGCLKGEKLTVSTTLMRGGLAQAMLLKDFPRFGVEPKIAAHLFARIDLPLDSAAASVDDRTASLYKLADCVVRNQAIKTESLFRSEPGSDLEGRVLDAMAPYIAACHGKPADLRVSRPEFRSLMAQAAYSVSARYWSGELWSAKN